MYIDLYTRVIFGEEQKSVKLHGAFASFFGFLIFVSVMFHSSFFQTRHEVLATTCGECR